MVPPFNAQLSCEWVLQVVSRMSLKIHVTKSWSPIWHYWEELLTGGARCEDFWLLGKRVVGCPCRGLWDPDLFLFFSSWFAMRWAEFCFSIAPCHDMLPYHRPKASGTINHETSKTVSLHFISISWFISDISYSDGKIIFGVLHVLQGPVLKH